MKQERIILHIDMDAFFASVEQASNPNLRGKPVVVCGETSEQKKWLRTIITTASYEARKYGIKTGFTVPQAKKLCPQVIVVIANPDKYIDAALRIHEILLEYTDLVEVFSIDECFMDITCLKSEPKIIASRIKKEIYKKLNLTCSVGIGPNKLLAKLASEMHKPDGLVELSLSQAEKLFRTLPVEKLCGIGDKLARHLNKLGIYYVCDLAEANISVLVAHFGVNAYKLKNMGSCIDNSPVLPYSLERVIKSVGHSHTLAKDTDNIDVIQSYLRMLCEKVATRMKKYNFMGRTFTLFIRYEDFKSQAKRMTIKDYVYSGSKIYFYALQMLKKYFDLNKKVRLIGISVSSLVKSGTQQYLLEQFNKEALFQKTISEINNKYGDFFIKPANLIIAEEFGIEERCGMIGRYFFDRKDEK